MSGATVRSSRVAIPRGAALQPSTTPTGARLELVERQHSQRRRRSMLLCALLGAALVGGPFVVVSMHVRMAQQQYRLNELHKRIDEASQINRDAQARVANMGSADWIVPQAKRLGLQQPIRVRVLTIDHVLGIEQTPNTPVNAAPKTPANASATATETKVAPSDGTTQTHTDALQGSAPQRRAPQGSANASHP